MTTEEVLSYIEKQFASGQTKEQIRDELSSAGWTNNDIDESFDAAGNGSEGTAPLRQAEEVVPDGVASIAVDEPSKHIPNSSQGKVVLPSRDDGMHESSSTHDVGRDKISPLRLAIFSSLAVLLLVAGGAFAYFSFFSRPSPAKVFANMSEALSSVTSNKLSTTISVDVKGDSPSMGKGSVNITIVSDGVSDMSDPNNVKSRGSISIDVAASSGTFGVAFKVNTDIKTFGDIVYIKLNEVTGLPVPISLDDIIGKWIKIDQKELEGKIANLDGVIDSSPTVPREDLKKILEEDESLRDNVLAQLQKFLEETKEIIMRGVIEGEDTEIDGIGVYNYKIALDKNGWRDIIEKFVEIGMSVESEISPDIKNNLDEFDKFKSSDGFDKILDFLASVNTEIWVGKKDFLPYRVVSGLKFDNSQFEDPLNTARSKAGQAALKATLMGVVPSTAIFYDDNKNTYGATMKLGLCPEGGSGGTMFSRDMGVISAIRSAGNAGIGDVYCVAVGENGNASKYAISAPFKDGSGSFCINSDTSGRNGAAQEDATCGDYVPVTEATFGSMTLNGDVVLTYSASAYNEPVTIEVPSVSISLTDIISSITGGTIDSLGNARMKARDAIRKSEVSQARMSLELYYDSYGKYPVFLKDLVGRFSGSEDSLRDPVTKEFYNYISKSGGKDYSLCTDLDESGESFCVSSPL